MTPRPFHVAGVAQTHIYRPFAWQAWHLVTSTFVLRGRHGTWRHPPLFCHIPSLSHTTLSHTIFHTSSLTHHLGHTIFHTTLSHTIFDTPSQTIFHTPSFIHRFVSHHLSPHHPSHTTLSHTIFYTPSQTISHTPSLTTPSFTHQLCHTPSFTQLCHAPTLSHTIFHTPTLSHTIFHTTLCLTPSFTTPSFTQICHAPTLSLTIFHTPSSTHRHRPSFTHHPSHTTLSHTIFHTQLCHTQLSHTHTPSFTHNFVTHTHTRHHLSLSHTSFHIQLCHTQFCFTSRSSTTSFVFPSFPIQLQHLVLIIGGNCLVGLSGPLIYFRVYLLPHWNVWICGLHEARSPITSWRLCSTYINLYLIVCIILTPEKCVVLFRGCSKQGGDPALTRQSSKNQKHMRSEAATEMGGEASKWIYTMNTNKNSYKMHLPIVTQVLHPKQLPQRGV